MTALQKYWLVDQTGNKALADGSVERDRWLPLGWAETTEPTGSELVWCRHPDVADPARFPAETLPFWEIRGWKPSAPPEPDNFFSVVAPEASAPDPVTENKPKKPADGGTSTREN